MTEDAYAEQDAANQSQYEAWRDAPHDEAQFKRAIQRYAWESRDPPRIGKEPPLTFHRNFEAIKPKKYVVDGFLAEGEVSCFFGEPGATNGTIAVDIACHVASGLPWMGRKAGEILDAVDRRYFKHDALPTGVLYIALERAAQVQRRVEAFTDEHGLKQPMNLAIWSGPLDLVGSENDDILTAIYAHESAQRDNLGQDNADGYSEVRLVVIDTLSRAFGSGSDSGGEETAAVARKFERVLRFYPDLHILVVHHTPVGDDSRLRGHGNLLAAFDQTVRVRKHKVGSTATVMKDNDTAEEGKARFAYMLKSRVIHVDEDGRETTAPVVVPMEADAIKQPLPKGAAKAKAPKVSKGEQPVLDALAGIGSPVSETDWRAAYDAAKDEGVSLANHRTRFSRGKASLASKGLISEVDGKWEITVSELQNEKL